MIKILMWKFFFTICSDVNCTPERAGVVLFATLEICESYSQLESSNWLRERGGSSTILRGRCELSEIEIEADRVIQE